MKNKTILSKISALAVTILLLTIPMALPLSAQVIRPPLTADNLIGPVGYPNSSTIDYTPFCPVLGGCFNSQLTAVVADGGVGGPAPIMFVYDQVNLGGWLPVPLPVAPGSSPDVVVGNDIITLPGNQFIIGVVANLGGNIQLFLFSVAGVGTGALAVIPGVPAIPLPPVIPISMTGTATGAPHIDMIAEYSTPYFGLPLTRKFIITWADGGIWSYCAALDAPFAAPVPVNVPGANFSSPDVAAVERFNINTGAMEDWGLFCYVDQTVFPNVLMYQECICGGPSTPPVIYDNTLAYVSFGMVSTVRIDGIDDFSLNNPGPAVYPGAPPPANAFFDIVASTPIIPPLSGAAVVEYNNITGPFVPTDITSPVAALAGQKNIVPVVACGPGPFYSVGYFSLGPGPQAYYVTAVDWTTGVTPLPPPPPTSPGPDAWQTNSLAWGGPNPGYPWGIALSATSNTDASGTQNLFSTWENIGALWEKYSIPTYAFKHSSTTVSATTATDTWELAPNPAVNEVILTAPAGFGSKDGDTYHITDLSGKELQQGNISEATQQISVNSLPAGMYLLSVHTPSANTRTIKFVKE